MDVSRGDVCSLLLLLEELLLLRLSLHSLHCQGKPPKFSREDVCQTDCCEVFTSLEIQLLGDLRYAHMYV